MEIVNNEVENPQKQRAASLFAAIFFIDGNYEICWELGKDCDEMRDVLRWMTIKTRFPARAVCLWVSKD